MSGFVDEAQLHAKAGDGGAGAVSFRREAHVERGGPDGGDGGRGGDVWLVASANQASLLAYRDHPYRRAGDGGHGSGKRRHGPRGADLVVAVPVGTVVRDRDGAVLVDLSHEGDRWLAAEGGQGGRGNARFLSNTRRAPSFAEQGERGQERWLDLELKLVADVALVGFPNAGKSTLISAVSAAKPKIAAYPFTTLQPHLGVVRVGRGTDEVELVMADVPGLVEGAAEGRGLGHRFLRHVERARVLVVLVDLVPMDGTPARDQLRILLGELGRYRPELLERPRLVVGSKADVAGADVAGADAAGADAAGADAAGADAAGADGARHRVAGGRDAPDPPGEPPLDLVVSAVTGSGVAELLGRLATMVVSARRGEAQGHAVVVHRPAPEGIMVERTGPHEWTVGGRPAARAVNLSDLTDEGALAEAVRRLRRLGIDRSLSRAGAHDGDEVTVGPVSFTWYRDETLALEADGGMDAAAAAGRRRRRP